MKMRHSLFRFLGHLAPERFTEDGVALGESARITRTAPASNPFGILMLRVAFRAAESFVAMRFESITRTDQPSTGRIGRVSAGLNVPGRIDFSVLDTTLTPTGPRTVIHSSGSRIRVFGTLSIAHYAHHDPPGSPPPVLWRFVPSARDNDLGVEAATAAAA